MNYFGTKVLVGLKKNLDGGEQALMGGRGSPILARAGSFGELQFGKGGGVQKLVTHVNKS